MSRSEAKGALALERRGPLGRNMRVAKELCYLNSSYQRKPTPAKVAAIAKMFNWAVFGVLIVVMDEDGRFAIVDGGHRWMAVMSLDDITTIPVRVFDSYDEAEQAALFIETNQDRTKLAAVHLFKAKLAAGDAAAHVVQKILTRYGITVPPNPTRAAQNICTCPVSLLKWEEDALDMVVSFVVHAWPEDDNRMRVEVLQGVRGLMGILEKHGLSLVDEGVVRKIRRDSNLVALRQRAMALASYGTSSRGKAMVMALLEAYNKGRRTGQVKVGKNGED